MKYYFFTHWGDGLSIAYHLKKEGHDVLVGVVENERNTISEEELKGYKNEDRLYKKRRLSLYDGLLDKIPAEKLLKELKGVRNKDNSFVFFEFNNLFKYASQVSEMGFHGNFPTLDDHLFEMDRNKAKEFVKKNYPGLNIAEVREFDRVSEARDFLSKSDEIWVLKGKDEAAKTFVPDADDPELAAKQIIETLQTYSADYEKSGFILELLIPWMVEITPEKIYYDGVPIAVNIDIENKPLGSANLSIQTGCASDLVFPLPLQEKICEIAFPPIIDEIAKKHKGLFFWDASLLISKRGGKIYFGEFCSNRPGYNALYTELGQLPTVSHFFESLMNWRSPFTLGTVGTSTTIFNLAQNPEDNDILAGGTIDYKPEFEKQIWLNDSTKKGNRMVAAGYDTKIGAVTGGGKSIEEAVNKMYEAIKGFSFVGAYYRPKADFVSLDYPSSIPNRLNYGLERGLYQLPFNVKVGDIK
jgi:hypothetical protein